MFTRCAVLLGIVAGLIFVLIYALEVTATFSPSDLAASHNQRETIEAYNSNNLWSYEKVINENFNEVLPAPITEDNLPEKADNQ